MARQKNEGEVSDMTGQKTIDWSLRRSAAGVLVMALALGLGGCRTDREDVERWANTVQGPRKLVAVLTHDKYPIDLRVVAALTLIEMKPRGGRRVGIQGTDDQPGLLAALGQVPAPKRAAIVNRLVPALETELTRTPAAAKAGEPSPPDGTIPYKDAAFALLAHDGGRLIADDRLKQRLRVALANWA